MPTQELCGETRAAWWQAMFEASEDALVVCTADGAIHQSNPKAARFFLSCGTAPRTIYELTTERTSARLQELFGQERGAPRSLNAVSIFLNGQIRMLADVLVASLDADHWLVSVKDASRRWRMESHVHRLVTALDATPDVFFMTDAEYKITFVNGAFQTVTGHTIEECLGRSAEFLRAPEDRTRIAEYIAAVEAGNDWVGELTNVRHDGSRYPVEATISPVYDREGVLLGYVSCERDLSIKKKLQAELISERDFSRSILHSINAAVYALDRHYRLIQINSTWRQLPPEHGWLKLSEPPFEGMNFLDLVETPSKKVELKLAFDNVLQTGNPVELCCDSEGHSWLIKISPWKHQDDVVGLIYQVSDQTQLHELQNALYQAEKLKTIGSLAAGIAHDFNNLLMVIRANTTILLLAEDHPDHSRKYLEHIEQASSRAAEITQQLLAFTRASKEKASVFDFNNLIQEVAQLTGRSINSNIELKLSPSSQPAKVKMDPSRAHQVILNLCVNAQDAMPTGGVLEIRNDLVRLNPREAAKSKFPPGTPFLRCTVSDAGVGIPSDVLPRVFDPFFTTKETGRGTGLGLSIVHGIVTQTGGFIEVESEPGFGTAFHIFLPTVESEISVAEVQKQVSPCSGRLLIVDDIDLVLECTCDFLTALGFKTFSARNAAQALKILEQEQIDLILTDYNMPGMSGLELIARVKEGWPKVRCVLASGFLEEAAERKLIDEFNGGTLRKPYSVSEAAELVQKMLAESNLTSVQG